MPSSLDLSALQDLFSSTYLPDQPGAAVIVAQEGRALFRQGYGMANLELNVPIQPETVFRVGSVTKQFTAVSILMLMEQGLLNLDDPLEKFLPDYPVHGHTITVEHLLTHTSGIKSYTSMPEFEKIMTRDMTPPEVIDFFKGQPMEFAPGKRWNYNNSGYFLLGVIIEKLSGIPYADFLQQRIFNPLGLSHTYYDSTARIIPNRASGYTKQGETLVNDRYLTMTIPFAAGALASTIDDLAAWDHSLYSGRLVSLESLQRAWTPYRLTDGTTVHYGYGWGLHQFEGQPWIDHGGGINGFLCFAIRLPAEHLYIAVLGNTTAPATGPDAMAIRSAALALGKPLPEPRPVKLSAAELAALVGIYEEKPGEEFTLTVPDGKLTLSRQGWPEMVLDPIEGDAFTNQHMGLSRLCLLREPGGALTGFELRNIFGEVDITARKTDRPLPEPAPTEK